MRVGPLRGIVIASLVLFPAAAQGDLDGQLEPGVAVLLDAPQTDEFRVAGGGVSAKVSYGIAYGLAVQGSLGLLGFPGREDRSSGGAVVFGIGPRYAMQLEAGTPYADATIALARTGGLMRPAFELSAGFGAWAGSVRVGPFVKYSHIVGRDGPGVDGGDAKIVILGVGVGFGGPSRSARPVELDVEVAEVSDRDGDGVPDHEDGCPDEPGPPENQGCPWPDRDGDGVPDPFDECPDEPGPVDNQGCPWPDKDGDGVPDRFDQCPEEPGPAENQGCPWPDRDGDGVPDHEDKCPDEPGPAENDGCPLQAFVDRETSKIVIRDRILFELNSHTLDGSSHQILDAVAKVLADNPDIKKVRIEGHTDDRGRRAYNLRLSRQRAASVKAYLVGKGVESGRLESVGYGMSRPLVRAKTQEARDMNRRVEFEILEVEP